MNGGYTMTIDRFDLVDLLKGEIHIARIAGIINEYGDYDERVELHWGFGDWALLEWSGGQRFFIIESNNDEMSPGCTISVDEILDIVL
jgi:hypothetical protein